MPPHRKGRVGGRAGRRPRQKSFFQRAAHSHVRIRGLRETGTLKNWMETVLNFMLRAVFGMIAVFLINSLLQGKLSVGINPVSFLASGCLGLPGVALLYGLKFYFLL